MTRKIDHFVIATIKSWNIKAARQLMKADRRHRFHLIIRKEDLTAQKLDRIKPRFIFFPHWSWFIPPEIYNNFECVVFQETDLPFGRGGSPIQNLIVRGFKRTKVSAIKVEAELDAGDIYLQAPLALSGAITEILTRSSKIIFSMIKRMAARPPKPVPQKGKPVVWKRRRRGGGALTSLKWSAEIYDYIRMLDGEGYPRAFLETDYFNIEFDQARRKKTGRVEARAIFIPKINQAQGKGRGASKK